MAIDEDVQESYPLENGLPDYQVTPKPVEEFYQKYERYPAKVVVNLKHKVTWREYFIPCKRTPTPAIKPLENTEIVTHEVQAYHVNIEYNEEVDEKTLICRGFAKTP